MTTVAQLLDSKGRDVWSVAPAATVYDAIEMMANKSVGALLVLEDDNLAGIVSERDYARKVILEGRSSRETPVGEIMTTEVVTTRPDQTIEECMELMTAKHIRHLPVVEGNQVQGIVSIGDLVKTIIEEQKRTIEHLGHYISG